MNKKLNFLFASAILVVLLVVGLWTRGLASNTPSTADQDHEIHMVILTHDEETVTEVVNETVDIASDTTLMELMQQHYDIIVTEDGFIESIEGFEQQPADNLYWLYEANGDRVNEGAETFIPEDNDTITWELKPYEN